MFVISAQHMIARYHVKVKSYWTGACFGAKHLAKQFNTKEEAEQEFCEFQDIIPQDRDRLYLIRFCDKYFDFTVEKQPMGVTE